jgi:hypothetical protein
MRASTASSAPSTATTRPRLVRRASSATAGSATSQRTPVSSGRRTASATGRPSLRRCARTSSGAARERRSCGARARRRTRWRSGTSGRRRRRAARRGRPAAARAARMRMPARRTRSRRSCLRSTSHCTWTGGSPIPTRWSRRRRSRSPRSLPPTRATCASPPPSTSRAPRPTLWAVRSRVCRCTLHPHPHPHPQCTSTSTSTSASTSTLHQHLHATSCILHRTTCISHRALPRAQLETVAYACQRHNSTTLRSGERGGFFLGDGVGLGKGRQLAAIVYAATRRPRRPVPHTRTCRLPRASPRTPGPTPSPAAPRRWHNMLQGRQAGCALQQRAVWLSVSRDLGVDARRDLNDIGATETRTRTRTLILTVALALTRGVRGAAPPPDQAALWSDRAHAASGGGAHASGRAGGADHVGRALRDLLRSGGEQPQRAVAPRAGGRGQQSACSVSHDHTPTHGGHAQHHSDTPAGYTPCAHGGHTAVRERGAASRRWPRGWAAPRRRAASSATRATRPSTSPRPRRRAAPRRAARAAGAAAGGARRWGRSNRRLTLTLTLTQAPNSNQVGGSKTAECVSALQERCPRARVVYCSATGASAIEHMCYMRRLGLYYCISNSCHSPPTSHPSPLTTHHSPLPHH